MELEINFTGKHLVSGFLMALIISLLTLALAPLEYAAYPFAGFFGSILAAMIFMIFCKLSHFMLGGK